MPAGLPNVPDGRFRYRSTIRSLSPGILSDAALTHDETWRSR